jgi:hypothetical protein
MLIGRLQALVKTIIPRLMNVGKAAIYFVHAVFYSIIRFKLLVRVSALVLAVVLWHDNQIKYEKSRAYYKMAVTEGMKSQNEVIRKESLEAFEAIEKEKKKRFRRQ